MSYNIKKLIVTHLKQECVNKQNESLTPKEIARKLCFNLQERKELIDSIFIAHCNKNLDPIIQDGPQCGLVALGLAHQFLTSSELSLENLFETAKSHGYTLRGEMFSCHKMARLWTETTAFSAEVVLNALQEKDRIVNALLADQPILIPYDRDHNNEPCRSNGLKAHWALLTGAVFILEKSAVVEQLTANCEQDELMGDLFHHSTPTNSMATFFNEHCSIYVFAWQGRSRHVQLWSLSELLASNGQLTRVDPAILQWEGGVVGASDCADGLCSKVIIVSKQQQQL